ncbi:MAG: hypothetical protein V3R93_06155, partial [Candidatus Hydrothermarchaeaceae archaeon]
THTSQILKYNANATKMLLTEPLKKWVGVDLNKFGLPGQEKKRISEWVDEKTEGMHAKLLGKPTPILQLWKIRKKVEKI